MLKLLSIFMVLCSMALACAAKSSVYKFAPEAPKSTKNSVSVDGVDCHVYPAPIADIASFDILGETRVVVKSARKIAKVDVRPLSKNIDVKHTEDTVEFTISEPCTLSVEINGRENPLFIFANAPTKNPPKKGDKNVIFFEAGKIYEVGLAMPIPSDTTVFVEGGAVVYGTMRAGDQYKVVPLQNIRLCGNGIISGERSPKYKNKEKLPTTNHVEFHNITGLVLDGVCVIDSTNWAVPIFACTDVFIDGIKTVSDNACDDGLDIVSCKNVLVQNCFLRNRDDCIVIKAGVNYAPKYFKDNEPNNVENVTVRDCVIWNGIWGNGLEIGFETRGDEMKNIVFENIDAIHIQCNPGWKGGKEGMFTIHNGDRAKIHNVLYKNIRIEDAERYLIDFRIMFSRYSKDKQRGQVSDIRFENVSAIVSEPINCLFEGFDENCTVSGVSFKNVTINGRPIDKSPDVKVVKNKFTSDIALGEK